MKNILFICLFLFACEVYCQCEAQSYELEAIGFSCQREGRIQIGYPNDDDLNCSDSLLLQIILGEGDFTFIPDSFGFDVNKWHEYDDFVNGTQSFQATFLPKPNFYISFYGIVDSINQDTYVRLVDKNTNEILRSDTIKLIQDSAQYIGYSGTGVRVSELINQGKLLSSSEALTNSQNVLIIGDLLVDVDYTFTQSQIRMGKLAELIVSSHVNLEIEDSAVIGCAEEWDRLSIETHGSLHLEKVDLSGGRYALYPQDSAIVRIEDCHFHDNENALFVRPFFPLFKINPFITFRGITTIEDGDYGFNLSDCGVQNYLGGKIFFSKLREGISIKGNSSSIILSHTDFRECETAIHPDDANSVSIYSSTFYRSDISGSTIDLSIFDSKFLECGIFRNSVSFSAAQFLSLKDSVVFEDGFYYSFFWQPTYAQVERCVSSARHTNFSINQLAHLHRPNDWQITGESRFFNANPEASLAGANGLLARNVSNLTVKDNFQFLSPGSAVKLENTNNAWIARTKLVGFNADPIVLDGANNSQLDCNELILYSTENTGSPACKFLGNNSGTILRANHFQYVSASIGSENRMGNIGAQVYGGNRFTSSGVAHFQPFKANLDRFLVSDTTTLGTELYPHLGTSNLFVPTSNHIPFQCSSDSSEQRISIAEKQLHSISSTLVPLQVYAANNFDEDYLFDYWLNFLRSLEGLNVNDLGLENLRDSILTTDIGALYTYEILVKSKIGTFWDFITNDNQMVEDVRNKRTVIENLFPVSLNSITDSIVVDSLLNFQFTARFHEKHNLIEQFSEKDAASEFTDLLVNLNDQLPSITTDEGPAWNLYYMYAHMLQWMNPTRIGLIPGTSGRVNVIANACPDKAGEGVYWARSYSDFSEHRPLVFDDSCPEITSIPTDLREIEVVHLKVFPNPSSDIINIILPVHDKADNYLLLYDLYGKLHQSIPTNGQSELQIEVAHLPKGTYLLKSENGYWKSELIMVQ